MAIIYGYLAKVTGEQINDIETLDGVSISFSSKRTDIVGIESKYDIIDILRLIVGPDNVEYERTDGRLTSKVMYKSYRPYPQSPHEYMRNFVVYVDQKNTVFLSKLPTRLLMKYHKQARATGYVEPVYGMHVDGLEIKSVLDTREHVPNKIEARKIRQAKAKGRA
jgi:hypothetical protein